MGMLAMVPSHGYISYDAFFVTVCGVPYAGLQRQQRDVLLPLKPGMCTQLQRKNTDGKMSVYYMWYNAHSYKESHRPKEACMIFLAL